MMARLWHYTDGEALLAILKRRVLWASDSAYLNDAAELRTGRELLGPALEKAYEDLVASRDGAQALADHPAAFHTFERVLEDFRTKQYALIRKMPVYVCSFSEEDDSLSQWRAYGSYAIGFDEGLLNQAKLLLSESGQLDREANRNTSVASVQYVDPRDSENLIKEIRSWISKGLAGLTMNQLQKAITEILVRLKDKSFSEEKERRLRYIPGPIEDDVRVNYRVGQFSITPYVEYSFLKEAVGRVMVGPGPHQELKVAAINRLLSDLDYDDTVRAQASPTPYRT